MKLFHDALYYDVEDWCAFLDEFCYKTTREAAKVIPIIILSLGFAARQFRESMADGLKDDRAMVVIGFLFMFSIFLVFPISIPAILIIHYFVSKKRRKQRMLDALYGRS
jgi:hypothetical protein